MKKKSTASFGALSSAGALVLVGALGWPGAAEGAESAADLVARSIEHHGGEIYENSEISFRICSKGGCYDVVSRQIGGLYSHTVTGPDGRCVRASNDDVSMWREGEKVAVSPGDEQRLRNWVSARIYFALLPYRLQDPSVRLEDMGTEAWDGETLRKVRVTFESGSSTSADDVFLHWFDPETARLVQFAYSFGGDPGGLRFRELFDYRRVGGVLVFDQRNLGVEGDGLAVDMLTPEFVRNEMPEVSVVRLEGVGVDETPPTKNLPTEEPPCRSPATTPGS